MKVKGGGKKKNVAGASSEGLEDDPTTPVGNGGGKRCSSDVNRLIRDVGLLSIDLSVSVIRSRRRPS